MLGAGIFINTVELAKRAGILGAFSYTLVGILMLPLILCIVELLQLHPQGGFYIFGKEELNPFAGFISAWSYFVSKLASAMLIIHTAVLLIQQVIPPLQTINTLTFDVLLLGTFIALNMLNIKTGMLIQRFFLGFKLIPIFFVILTGIWFYHGLPVVNLENWWSTIPFTLPLVLYATVGFEAACSLSSKIENPQKNAPKAILYSYGFVIVITTLYQLLFYTSLGSHLSNLTSYLFAFPTLIHSLFPAHVTAQTTIISLMHLAIAASALGGSYGILFSNNWNVYTLAMHNHTFFPRLLTALNRHHIPWACMLLEGFICLVYLFVTQGKQIPLQQTSALGSVCAYTISVIALLSAKQRKSVTTPWAIPLLGLCNCFIFMASCIANFMINGITTLATFCALVLAGIVMFVITKKTNEA